MPEYLDDPSVLTKDKLKSELLAHNVELPSGNPTKDVYVQLYLNNLTARKHKHAAAAATLDAFSSDEELPPPVHSSRSRSSGRKATRKTDKVRPDELDVTVLTDQGLKAELLKHGVDVGPVLASTRKLYEKKLQKLLDDGPAQPPLVLTEIQVNHNGNSESDLYSDMEEVTAAPEPVADPEPAPVVARPRRSPAKTPVTTRTRSSQHHTIVPENLRPVLTDQVRRVHHRLDSPTRAEQRSISSRPAQSEEQSPRPAARPSSPLVPRARVDPVSFSPMCNISPIKRKESHWSLSDQFGPEPGGVSAAGEDRTLLDILLHQRRPQNIPGLMSATRSPVKMLGCTSALSKDASVGQVEKIAASDQTPKVEENDVLKELFPNDVSPTGITATCRRPIRGAAGRPVKSSDLWNNENSLFSPKTTKTTSSSSSSYTESRTANRISSLPPSAFTPSARPLSAAPLAGQTKAARRSVSLWLKLFLLAIVAAFLFLVYQAMETNTINPFVDTAVDSGSTA